jgi:hypothetical protein
VQGQGDAEAGEDQGGGIRDRGLEGGDGWEAAGGLGHPVLGGEADRRGGRGQDAQAGGGVTQPQARAVLAGLGSAGAEADRVVRVAGVREGWTGWTWQDQGNSGCHAWQDAPERQDAVTTRQDGG